MEPIKPPLACKECYIFKNEMCALHNLHEKHHFGWLCSLGARCVVIFSPFVFPMFAPSTISSLNWRWQPQRGLPRGVHKQRDPNVTLGQAGADLQVTFHSVGGPYVRDDEPCGQTASRVGKAGLRSLACLLDSEEMDVGGCFWGIGCVASGWGLLGPLVVVCFASLVVSHKSSSTLLCFKCPAQNYSNSYSILQPTGKNHTPFAP